MLYTLRNLWHVWRKFKTAGLFNLLGLSVAFATFLIVLTHVRFEYGYDRFHPNADRLYLLEYCQDGVWRSNAARTLAERFIASSAHIEAGGLWLPNYDLPSFLSVDNRTDQPVFREYVNRISPGFTRAVRFDMLSGNADALQNPDQILIPQSMATRFFGPRQAVGKPVTFTGKIDGADGRFKGLRGGSYYPTVTVGGVYRDFPANSIFSNDVYGSLDPREYQMDDHTGIFYCLVELDSPDSRDLVIDEFKKNYRSPTPEITDFRLSSVPELHFSSTAQAYDTFPKGNRQTTQILLAIALLVVAIASVNLINFSIALTPFRIKAINTQRVFGSLPGTQRRQLTAESVLVSSLAFLLSLLIVTLIDESRLLEGIFPPLSVTGNWGSVVLTAALALAVGTIAGVYPARYMTSFPTVMALSGTFALSWKARFVKKSLIGLQYVISIALIIAAIFIQLQNDYVRRADLGFERDHLWLVELNSKISTRHSEYYKKRLLEHPGIRDVAFSQQQFLQDGPKPYNGVNYRGEHYYHFLQQVSYNFPALIGVRVTEGRDFVRSDEERTDHVTSYIFNRTAARQMGLRAGDSIERYYIAGIFPDIHFESMHLPIAPMAFAVSPQDHWDISVPLNYSYIRTVGDDPTVTKHIGNVLHEIDPGFPAEIKSFDSWIDTLYTEDDNLSTAVSLLCLLSVLLSMIGVFGLVVFEMQARTKEIALRKVMGSTVPEILGMFNAGFVRIVLVCFAVATPLAWWSVSKWLENFSYRTPIRVWVFPAALLLTLLLTAAIVTFQSFRTATANPARSLKK